MAAPDDLDALLASLMEGTPEPPPVPAAPAISPERQADHAHVRAWLAERHPNARVDPNWQPQPDPGYVLAALARPEEPLDPETLAELAAALAWRDRDQTALDAALARLPPDRADHHRRMAAVSDQVRQRQRGN